MQNIIFFMRENLILSMIWFFLLLLIISFTIQNILSKVTIINYHEAKELINKENAVVVDTRLVELFNKKHIINSINISLQEILSGNIDKLQLSNIYPIILIFSELNQYKEYVNKLYTCGFHRIYILEGGINSWDENYLYLSENTK